MEKLEKLSKLLRYAGLNLTPQILQILLDLNVRKLVDNLDAKLDENPNPSLEDIDVIIEEIQIAAEAQAKADALKAEKSKPKAKPALEKA